MYNIKLIVFILYNIDIFVQIFRVIIKYKFWESSYTVCRKCNLKRYNFKIREVNILLFNIYSFNFINATNELLADRMRDSG
jgi:hypothetical protein